jgi:hypothetical protein
MKKTGYFLFFLVLQLCTYLQAPFAVASEKSHSLSYNTAEQFVSGAHSQAPEMETVSAPLPVNFSAAKGVQKIPALRSTVLNSAPSFSLLFTEFDAKQGCPFSAKKYLTHNYPFHSFW